MTENPTGDEEKNNLSNSELEDRVPTGFIEGANSVILGRATHFPKDMFGLIRDIKRIITESHL